MSSLFDSQRYTLLWLFKGRWLALVQPWPGTIWAWPGHPATQTATRPPCHPATAIRPAGHPRPPDHMPAVRPRPSGQPATPTTCKLPGHRPRPRPYGNGHPATATRPRPHTKKIYPRRIHNREFTYYHRFPNFNEILWQDMTGLNQPPHGWNIIFVRSDPPMTGVMPLWCIIEQIRARWLWFFLPPRK